MTHNAGYRRILARMGYYNYQSGLIYRHLGQEGGWDEHLEKCRRYIMETVEHLNPEKITILGSGWLLDLPLAEILEKTKKVILVDIIHPPEVVEQVSLLGNVELLEADVTGGLIEEVWTKTMKYSFFKRLRSLSGIQIPEFTPGFDPGMVISLNLLTQLEILLIEFLKRRSWIKREDFDSFRRAIQEKHLDFLVKYRSVMISDVQEVQTGLGGTVKVVPTLYADIPPGKRKEEWTWNFDLKGIDYYNSRSVMKVIAVTYGS